MFKLEFVSTYIKRVQVNTERYGKRDYVSSDPNLSSRSTNKTSRKIVVA